VRATLAAAALALVLAAPAAARVNLGILGSADRFRQLTGQDSAVRHVIVGWGQGQTYGSNFQALLDSLSPIPMLGFGTVGWGGQLTPLQIAQGRGDAYLIAMNNAVSVWGKFVYIRPMGEMNGHWNPYCAFTADGKSKGPQYATSAFRKAFARIYVILHGGPEPQVDAKLRRLGLPLVGRDLLPNPTPTLKVVWNPQGYGSPDVPGNSAQAYYPGDGYVDVVGDDLYDIGGKAEFAAADALYRAHPSKPFAFPEWGLWGLDDPAFVRKMAQWVRAHQRTELLSYFNSRPGSRFDLGSKPKSLAAYRAAILPLGS
jgi:hypothetical protein